MTEPSAQALIARANKVKPFVSMYGPRGGIIVDGRSYVCLFCGKTDDSRREAHDADCLWLQIKAALSAQEAEMKRYVEWAAREREFALIACKHGPDCTGWIANGFDHRLCNCKAAQEARDQQADDREVERQHAFAGGYRRAQGYTDVVMTPKCQDAYSAYRASPRPVEEQPGTIGCAIQQPRCPKCQKSETPMLTCDMCGWTWDLKPPPPEPPPNATVKKGMC